MEIIIQLPPGVTGNVTNPVNAVSQESWFDGDMNASGDAGIQGMRAKAKSFLADKNFLHPQGGLTEEGKVAYDDAIKRLAAAIVNNPKGFARALNNSGIAVNENAGASEISELVFNGMADANQSILQEIKKLF